MSILVAEELDFLDAQNLRRRPLLLLADSSQLGVLLLGVLPALRSIGDDDVGDLGPVFGQLGHGPTGRELGVVGMRGNDKHSFELGCYGFWLGSRLAFRFRCALLCRHRMRVREVRPLSAALAWRAEPTSPASGEASGPGYGPDLALAGAAREERGIAGWIGFHKDSICSGLRRVR